MATPWHGIWNCLLFPCNSGVFFHGLSSFDIISGLDMMQTPVFFCQTQQFCLGRYEGLQTLMIPSTVSSMCDDDILLAGGGVSICDYIRFWQSIGGWEWERENRSAHRSLGRAGARRPGARGLASQAQLRPDPA
ncbi:hypothetical protein DHEL01_v206982 [Diaporthe helianthi]|uniref:Uncharacterized protein n=1 Tax=Diaporthe helianthi TaxID=158607 RepID=A0A2P5HWI8_DIAHE|nr:hypothetical protein DHEL01_v206982 [Diaporthe helianthi]